MVKLYMILTLSHQLLELMNFVIIYWPYLPT